MSSAQLLPDEQALGYLILSLTAILGEFPTHQLLRLPGGESYKLKVIQSLKRKRLLRSFYRDGLRGYRLTGAGKDALYASNPLRYSFALAAGSETSHLKSEPDRRLRLHRIAEATVTMMNAGVIVHRDQKPDIFCRDWEPDRHTQITAPVFYNSREMKALGENALKIHGARYSGILLSAPQSFVIYNLGDSLMKWKYKAEMRTKAVMNHVLTKDRLPRQLRSDAIHGLLLGSTMELAYRILTCPSREQYFVLDGGYDHFYFLTNDRQGERLLRLLCKTQLYEQLEDLLLGDFYERDEDALLENDAMDENDCPVLLACLLDLPRIRRFNTAIELRKCRGTLICFDFQADVLRRYCCDDIGIQTVDFEKWERSFFG